MAPRWGFLDHGTTLVSCTWHHVDFLYHDTTLGILVPWHLAGDSCTIAPCWEFLYMAPRWGFLYHGTTLGILVPWHHAGFLYHGTTQVLVHDTTLFSRTMAPLSCTMSLRWFLVPWHHAAFLYNVHGTTLVSCTVHGSRLVSCTWYYAGFLYMAPRCFLVQCT